MNRKDFVVAWQYKDLHTDRLQCNACSWKRSDYVERGISGFCHGVSCNNIDEFNNEKHIAVITVKECYFIECIQTDTDVCIFKRRYKLKCPKE